MTQKIDVTGLPPAAVGAVQIMVDAFREMLIELPAPGVYWSCEPPVETAETWVARFRAYLGCHPEYVGVLEIDDDRGSMNDRNGAN